MTMMKAKEFWQALYEHLVRLYRGAKLKLDLRVECRKHLVKLGSCLWKGVKILGCWIGMCALQIARLLFYLPSLIIRLIVVFLYFVAKVAPLSLPILAGYAGFVVYEILYAAEELPEAGSEHFALIRLLLALGFFPTLLTFLGKTAWNALKEMVSEVWHGRKRIKMVPPKAASSPDEMEQSEAPDLIEIFPSWKASPALTKSRELARQMVAAGKRQLKKGLKLALLVGAIVFLALMAYFYNESEDRPQGQSEDRYHVAVVSTANPQAAEIKRYFFLQGGTVFSLTHLKNADKSGEGICLKKRHKEWLAAL